MIVKKTFNQWVYNEQEIIKALEESGVEANNKTIVDHLLECAINNKKFRRNVLDKMSKTGELHSFYIHGSYLIRNKILRKINSALRIFPSSSSISIAIDSRRLIEHLEEKKDLNDDETIFLENIKEYSSSTSIIEKILNKKINSSITYKDLIYFFMKSSEEFDNSIVDDKILGLTFSKVLGLVNREPISSRFIRKMNVSELMKDNFETNAGKLYDLIEWQEDVEEGKEIEMNFRPVHGLEDKFQLNSELKDKIMHNVPNHFTPLQKAYCIYRLLCQEFTYDEEYFYLKYCVPHKDHNDFSRLANLKGGEDVICTGFSLIYAKFLELLGVPFTTLNYEDELITSLSEGHIKIRFKIDEYIIDADGATDLYGSDMVTQKTKNRVNKFQLVNSYRCDERFEKELKEVDKYFESISANNEYDYAIDMYRRIYLEKNKEYSKLSFLERVDLIKEIILNSKLKFFDMIEMCSDLRGTVMADYYDKIKIEFIVRKNVDAKDATYNLNILIIYNENNNIYCDYNQNKYIVITPDRKIEELTYELLKQRFDSSIYDFTKKERNMLGLKEEEVTNGRKAGSRRTSR